jgi:hypothetical protein
MLRRLPARSRIWVSALVLGVLPLLPAQSGAADRFQIQSAQWRVARSELKIEGWAAKPGNAVLVRDAETRALLGCAAVRADGKWVLKIRNPKKIPAKVGAECDEGSKQCRVITESATN